MKGWTLIIGLGPWCILFFLCSILASYCYRKGWLAETFVYHFIYIMSMLLGIYLVGVLVGIGYLVYSFLAGHLLSGL